MGKKVVHKAYRLWGTNIAMCDRDPYNSRFDWELRWPDAIKKRTERWCKKCVKVTQKGVSKDE